MTPIPARPVQEVAPPEARPTPDAPPAAKPPEMVAPDPAAKPRRDTAEAGREAGGQVVERGSRQPARRSRRAMRGWRPAGAPIPFGGLATGRRRHGGVQPRRCRLLLSRATCSRWQTDQAELEPEPGSRRPGRGEVHDPARRDDHEVEVEKPSGQFAARSGVAARAPDDRGSCRRCRASSPDDADRSPDFRIPPLMTHIEIVYDCRAALRRHGACASARSSHRPPQPRQAAAAGSRARSSDDRRRAGPAAEIRGAGLRRVDQRCRDGRGREDDRRRCCGTTSTSSASST